MINAVTADRLRMVLLEPAARSRHATEEIDITAASYWMPHAWCPDPRPQADRAAGLSRRWPPAVGTVSRMFSLTGLNLFISHFGSLPDAFLQQPADTIRSSDPSSSAGPGFPTTVRPRTGRREENRAGRSLLPQFLLGICTIKD